MSGIESLKRRADRLAPGGGPVVTITRDEEQPDPRIVSYTITVKKAGE